MATHYKPNVWYGWNGGECPVHPKSAVETVTDAGANDAQRAEAWVWDCRFSPIRAFRVVKEYRAPIECWVPVMDGKVMATSHRSREQAEEIARQVPGNIRIALFREVMDGEAQ